MFFGAYKEHWEDNSWSVARPRQVAVKCIERSKYEQHVARQGQLNERPHQGGGVMEYIVERAVPRMLPLLARMRTSRQFMSSYPSARTGIFRVVERDGGSGYGATYMGQIVVD